MSRKEKPGALDEFLVRQDLAQNPANFMGGDFRSVAHGGTPRKTPFIKLSVGIVTGVIAAVLLLGLVGGMLEGNWFVLTTIAFIVGLSALLIWINIRSLRSDKPKRKHRKKK